MISSLIKIPQIPGIEELISTAPGKATVLSGVNPALAAMIACETAAQGKKILIITENDLKAARLADDVRQLTGGEGSCLPGGEIDLTRAAGSLENSWRRLEALSAVSEGNVRILCAGAEATAQRMGRPEPFKALSLRLKAGDVFPPADLARRLSRMGYDRVEMVEGKGQFARRGSILDVYPPALSQGLRIEFFDDEIDGIRLFDCISQRSLGEAEEAVLTPAAEALLDEEEYPAAAERMREAVGTIPGAGNSSPALFEDLPPLPDDEDDAALFDKAVSPKIREKQYQEAREEEADRRVERLREDAELLEQGLPFRRMRAWLPVLTDRTATICDWFRPDLILLCEPDRLRTRIEERLEGFAEDLKSAMERREAVAAQADLLTDWAGVLRTISSYPLGLLTELLHGLGGIRPETAVSLDAAGIPGYGGQIRNLKSDITLWREKGYRIFLLSGGSSRGKRLEETLKELGEKACLREDGGMPGSGEAVILPATLSGGFVLKGADGMPGTAVVSDADIWGEGYRRS